jgi:hypothetical protein
MLEQISTQTFAKVILVFTGFFYGYVLIMFRKEISGLLRKNKIIKDPGEGGP